MVGLKKYHERLLIPIGLCELVVVERLWTSFKVYIYLKAHSNGHLRLSGDADDSIYDELGIIRRTLFRSLRVLKNRNWIGKNKETGVTIINGFDVVRRLEKIYTRRGVWFDTKDLSELKNFVVSSLFTKLIIQQKRNGGRDDQLKGRSVKSRPFPYYPISLSSIVRIYNLKQSNASILRAKAAQSHYMKMCPDYEFLEIPITEIDHFRQSCFNPQSIVIYKGSVCRRKPNMMRSYLMIGRRRRV